MWHPAVEMRAALVVVALLLLAPLPATGASVPPSLRLAGDAVQGSHFRARERVRVVFLGTVRDVRSVRAGTTGAFTVPLPARDPCNETLLVLASGSGGDQARLKLPQRACPPPARVGG